MEVSDGLTMDICIHLYPWKYLMDQPWRQSHGYKTMEIFDGSTTDKQTNNDIKIFALFLRFQASLRLSWRPL